MSEGTIENTESEIPVSDYEIEEQKLITAYTEKTFNQIRSSIPGDLSGAQLAGLRTAAENLAIQQRDSEKKYKYDRLMNHLLSRAALEDELGKDLQEKERASSSTGVLAFIDLNNLKLINDTLGHELGDAALLMVDKVLSTTRPEDTKGRWGGDEALIFFKNNNVKDAAVAVERIRQSLKSMDAARGDGPLGVSFSIGLVPFHTGMSLKHIVAEADKTMYVAKHQLNKDAIAISGMSNPTEIEETHSYLQSKGINAPIVSVPNIPQPTKAA